MCSTCSVTGWNRSCTRSTTFSADPGVGEAGNDVLMLHVPAVQSPTEVEPPPPLPLGIRFEGGDGLADSFRLIGTDVAERVDAVSMQDFHDIALGDAGSVLQKVRALAFGTERVFIDAGAGDNRVDFRLSGPPGIVPWVVDLRSGDGNDHIRVDLDGGSDDVTARVDSGSGDDVVELDGGELLPPKLDCKIDLGLGEDLFILETLRPQPQSPVPPPGPDPGPEFRLNLRAGGGNDRINALLESVGLIAVWNVAMGDGDDTFDLVSYGSGIYSLDVLGGAGRDTLEATAFTGSTLSRWDTRVNLGSHDDVMSWSWMPADPTGQSGSLDLRMTAITGTGADVVDLAGLASAGDNRWNFGVNLGAHDDEFGFDFNTAAARSMQLNVNLLGGTGNDSANLVGYVLPYATNMNLNLSLGIGADIAAVDLTTSDSLPPQQATRAMVNMVVNGGLGNDQVQVRLNHQHQNFGLDGRVRVLGSAGNDNACPLRNWPHVRHEPGNRRRHRPGHRRKTRQRPGTELLMCLRVGSLRP